MGNKTDSIYMQEALKEIEIIINYVDGLTYDELMKDRKTNDAIIFRLQQMIEHIKNISQEFKKQHNEVPWNDIVGFRNRIVHQYGKTDYSTVYEIVTINIYQLKELFLSCI